MVMPQAGEEDMISTILDKHNKKFSLFAELLRLLIPIFVLIACFGWLHLLHYGQKFSQGSIQLFARPKKFRFKKRIKC